jgi:hypothetical protein
MSKVEEVQSGASYGYVFHSLNHPVQTRIESIQLTLKCVYITGLLFLSEVN